MKLPEKPVLLIDGYNLMHAAGVMRAEFGPGEFRSLREKFIASLAEVFSEAQRKRTTFVFDAQNAPEGQFEEQYFRSMTIIYARKDGDADREIEDWISDHSHPRRIVIISSDHRLHKAARKRKAKAIDSEVFVADLLEAGPIARQLGQRPAKNRGTSDHPKYSGATPAMEVSRWMSIFGSMPETQELKGPVDDLQREIDRITRDEVE